MFKLLSAAASLILAGAAIAQSTQPGRTMPSQAPIVGAGAPGGATPR